MKWFLEAQGFQDENKWNVFWEYFVQFCVKISSWYSCKSLNICWINVPQCWIAISCRHCNSAKKNFRRFCNVFCNVESTFRNVDATFTILQLYVSEMLIQCAVWDTFRYVKGIILSFLSKVAINIDLLRAVSLTNIMFESRQNVDQRLIVQLSRLLQNTISPSINHCSLC